MQILEPKLEYDPTDPLLPFTLSFTSSMFDPYEIHLTEEQMVQIMEQAWTPLMRRRAARSTPGLVES